MKKKFEHRKKVEYKNKIELMNPFQWRRIQGTWRYVTPLCDLRSLSPWGELRHGLQHLLCDDSLPCLPWAQLWKEVQPGISFGETQESTFRQKRSSRIFYLKLHRNLNHRATRQRQGWPCDDCDKTFMFKPALNNHMKKNHGWSVFHVDNKVLFWKA